MTQTLEVNSHSPDPQVIQKAAQVILDDGLVAFPTETVYGLGANALSPKAVGKIFLAKGRPFEDPLIVHIHNLAELERVAIQLPEIAYRLAKAFWPGPLTLVLKKGAEVPARVTAGLDTVAVRMPAHPVALALLSASQVPIAAPSANRFGHASPTTAQHVLADLESRVDLILDGGPATIGLESTVLDITRMPPSILRPGGVSLEELQDLAGPVEVRTPTHTLDQPQPSPGMLPMHYAPQAELVFFPGQRSGEGQAEMASMADEFLLAGRRVGLLLAEEDIPRFSHLDVEVFSLGSQDDLSQVARNLYTGLRSLDERGVEVILARGFGEGGIGLAIRDRLRRAASRVVD
jgi:L-threonylcarbamoyladenylate synthase